MDDDKTNLDPVDQEAVGDPETAAERPAEVKKPRKRKAKAENDPPAPSPPPSWAISGPIPSGARGDVIEALQRAIAMPVSGVLDRATANRVRDFQRVNGLTPTGRVDAATRRMLHI